MYKPQAWNGYGVEKEATPTEIHWPMRCWQ